MDTHAQSGNAVNVRRKPKHRPPRTRVLPMKAARNTGCLHMGLPSSGFIFALTLCVRRAGHLSNDKQQGVIRRRLHAVVGPRALNHRQRSHNQQCSLPVIAKRSVGPDKPPLPALEPDRKLEPCPPAQACHTADRRRVRLELSRSRRDRVSRRTYRSHNESPAPVAGWQCSQAYFGPTTKLSDAGGPARPD